MEQRRPGRLEPIPPIQLGLLAVAIVALAVVVGSASRPGDAGPAAPPSSPETGAAILRAGLVLVVCFEAAVLGLLAWALTTGGRRGHLKFGGERWLASVIAFLQSAAVLVGFWLYIHFHPRLVGANGGPLSGLALRPPAVNLPDRAAAVAGGQDWLTAALVAVALLAAGAFAVRSLLRRRDRRTPLQRLAGRLQEAVEEGLGELEAEPDPRRAVISAYARMERSLARVGLPRKPAETAIEYLSRLLQTLQLDDSAAGRLTDLFQLAKFSDHPVDETMKRQAIESLAAVRDDLAALAAERSTAPVPA